MFAQPAATFPLTLRALRINKLFKARDEYWITGKFPKKTIKNWSEKRIIFIFIMIGIFALSICFIISSSLSNTES